jgi:putative transferase (TIGR04331 family)
LQIQSHIAEAPTALKQLVIDTIPHDFSPETHRALGPWCFFGVEERYPDWDELPFVEPFPSPAARDAGGRISSSLVQVLLDRLWPKMNQQHATQYSREFWRSVLSDWLIYLVMLSWRIWRHVEDFVEMTGQETFKVRLLAATGRFQFADTQDFVTSCTYHSEFRSWLINETVRRQAPKHWSLETVRHVTPASAFSPNVERRLRWPVERLSDKVFYGGRLARIWRLIFSIYVNLLPRRPPQARRRITAFAPREVPPAFIDLVTELATSTMPESLRGGFSALDAEAKRHRYRRNRLYLLSINPHDDLGNVILGHAVEAGERVVALQHGGVYGWAAIDWLHATNEYAYDTFASWGFTEHGDYRGRFFPLPSPMLSSIRNAPRNPSGDIIMVGAFMYGVLPRFDCYPPMMDYRRAKRRFIGRLSDGAAARLRYRQYPSRHTFSDTEWLRRFFPDLRTIEGDVLIEALSRSTLVVLDHPSTTICQTMAGNIPTIGYWDWNAWPLARQAEPYFAGLERAGILFRTPDAAADQVNAVWQRAQEWWNEPQRQRARLLWCEQFALFDKHCWLSWLRRLPAI